MVGHLTRYPARFLSMLFQLLGVFVVVEVVVVGLFLLHGGQKIRKKPGSAESNYHLGQDAAFRRGAVSVVDDLQFKLTSEGGQSRSQQGKFMASVLSIAQDDRSIFPFSTAQSTIEGRNPGLKRRTESPGQRQGRELTFLLVLSENGDLTSFLKQLRGNLMEACLYIAADNSLVKDGIPKSRCLRVVFYKNLNNLAKVWHTLLKEVKTPYVLMLTSLKNTWLHSLNWLKTLSLFDNDKHIQVITFPRVQGKMRSLNCYRYDLHMYQLSLISEPYEFISGHPLCHFSSGPFVSRTSVARNLSWYGNEKVMILDFFLQLMLQGMAVAQCSRCGGVSVAGDGHVFDDRESLVPFARRWELSSISLGKTSMKFTCEETGSVCSWETQKIGKAMPLCCSVKQNEVTVEVLRLCQRLGVHHEFNEGSILGAVKLGCSMPWDIDGDIHYEIQNKTWMKRGISGGLFHARLRIQKLEKYSAYEIKLSHWRYKGIHVDLYPYDFLQKPLSRSNVKDGRLMPTRVRFTHWLAPLSFNPGLRVRNRYGLECFQHSLHWKIFSSKEQPMFGGRFMPCYDSTHHACLDVFMPDGNLQFKSWGKE